MEGEEVTTKMEDVSEGFQQRKVGDKVFVFALCERKCFLGFVIDL